VEHGDYVLYYMLGKSLCTFLLSVVLFMGALAAAPDPGIKLEIMTYGMVEAVILTSFSVTGDKFFFRGRSRNFKVEYLSQFEAIFKNILGGYSGTPGWLNHEKTWRSKML